MTREMQIARLRAAYEYWSEFNRNQSFSPFLHPPNLFQIDPFVQKPFYVPMGFIPEYVGGSINVVNRSQDRLFALETEPKEFIMANFLPGGYKKRWHFKHWQALWEPSQHQERAADVSRTFVFARKIPLSDVYAEKTFSRFQIATDQVMIYFPETVFVQEVRSSSRFFWSEATYLLTQRHSEESTHDIMRDPLSSPLFDTIQISSTNASERNNSLICAQRPSIIQSIDFIPDFRLIRCFYANCLQLFTREQPLTRVIRFYHDKDNRHAVIGTEHISQAVVFTIDVKPLISKTREVLVKDPIIENDLRFSFLRSLLNRKILFGDSLLDSLYDTDWIFGILLGLDYWVKRESADYDIRHFLNLAKEEQKDVLSQLVPAQFEIRLRLAGYTLEDVDRFIDLLDTHSDSFNNLFDTVYNNSTFDEYLHDVIANTIEKAIQVWSQRLFSVVGDGLTFWHSSIDKSGFLYIYAYDSYQGGTGIAREFYSKISSKITDPSVDINDQLRRAIQCDVDIADATIHRFFSTYDTSFLSGIFSIDDKTQNDIILKSIKEEERTRGITLREKDKEDIATFVKLDCKRLASSEEIIALYRELAIGYSELRNSLKRTPTIVDLLLYASANRFFDPRAIQMFDYFRTTKKGDLSEIYVRVSEILSACTSACPECLDFGNYYGKSIGESYHLDKRLLQYLLEVVS